MRDGFGYVGCVQSACEEKGFPDRTEQRPVKALTGSAFSIVKQQIVCRRPKRLLYICGRADREGFDDGKGTGCL